MMDDRFVTRRILPMHDTNGGIDGWTSRDIVEVIISLVLTALFVWAVVMVVRYSVKFIASKTTENSLSPLDIAKKRLASGEITKAEFEDIKKELK